MKFYNTLSKRKEEFEPLIDGEVGLYTCGPTVYDFAHIGNFRAYIFEDLLRRVLEYDDFKVVHIMNITDIDDKTIRESIRTDSNLIDYTEKYIKAFHEDVKNLNLQLTLFPLQYLVD